MSDEEVWLGLAKAALQGYLAAPMLRRLEGDHFLEPEMAAAKSADYMLLELRARFGPDGSRRLRGSGGSSGSPASPARESEADEVGALFRAPGVPG